jgi:predicted deacylase
MSSFTPSAALPDFKVRLYRPAIAPWVAGNTGIAGITTRDSGVAGPHAALFALMHGNELAGAIVLDRLLAADLIPIRGKLSFGFLNLAAFDRFDPQRPTASRFIDEDMNRVWDEAILNGPRQSIELSRAREIRPFVDQIDVLLDLHSMLWPSEPLILSGTTEKGRLLAKAIGSPPLVVADRGHVNGRRLIDFARFADAGSEATACLVEAGQHWEPATVDVVLASVAGLLRHLDMVAPDAPLPQVPTPTAARVATVTAAVTAMTSSFTFAHTYRGGDIIPSRDTLIAMDGATEIRTPHDNCLLVMPSLRPSRGHTAVRLGRFE